MTDRTLDEFIGRASTDSESVASEADADSASPTVMQDSGVYRQSDAKPISKRGDSADEVDPRRLVDDPTLDEIRWYYRYSLAKTIVDKPIRDAFKNGFDVLDGNAEAIQERIEALDFVKQYTAAQIKARRDGFSLLYYVLRDETSGIHEEPHGVRDVKALNVFTIDDLKRGGVSKHRIVDKVDLDVDEFEVRDTGIVVNKDPMSAEYENPIAYVLDFDEDKSEPTVVHADRCQHFTWNTEVDGDLDSDTLGEYEGDSVLLPLFHLCKGMMKGNWAVMQTLYRYSAQMYSLNMPEGSGEEAVEAADNHFSNLNAKSEIILPHPDYEIKQFGTDGQLDPSPHFDIIFEQICAVSEMTKSVLFGTQSGTVSGSETDIKNYFNKVERMRSGRIEGDIATFVANLAEWTTDDIDADDFRMSWNPMFRLSDSDRIEAMRTLANTGVMLVDGFALTPDEVRSLMEQEWSELGVDFELDELTEEDREDLEWVNFGQRGLEMENHESNEGGSESERHRSGGSEPQGNPRKQNGGGMPKGGQTASEQPNADDSESDDESDDDDVQYEF